MYDRKLKVLVAICFIVSITVVRTATALVKESEATKEFEELSTIEIGTLRIENIPRNGIKVTRTESIGDYLFLYATIKFQGSGKFVVYDRPLTDPTSLEPDSREVILSGTLSNVSIKGKFSLFRSSPQATQRINKGDLNITLGRIKSALKPLYGGVIDLSGHKIWVTNQTDIFSRAGQGTTGQIQFRTESLELEKAKVRFFNIDQEKELTFKSSASVQLVVDLQDGQWSLAEGSFELSNVQLDFNPPVSFLVAQCAVKELSLIKMARILVSASNSAVTFQIHGFSTSANSFDRMGEPYVSGIFSRPFSFEKLTASVPFNRDRLQTEREDLSNARILLSSAQFRAKDGFSIGAGAIDLIINKATKEHISGAITLSDANAAIAGSAPKRISLSRFSMNFDGQTEGLDGSGIIEAAEFRIDGIAEFNVGQWFNKCKDKPLRVHLEGTTGGFSGPFELRSGNIVFRATINDFTASFESEYYRCDYTEPFHIEAQKAHYKYWCPTWSEPGRVCEGWTYITPEISGTIEMRAQIDKIVASRIILSSVDAKVSNEGIELCKGKILQLDPSLIVTSVGPSLRDTGNPIGNIPRDLLAAFIGTGQTLLASTISNFAAAISWTGVGQTFYAFQGC